MGFDLENFRITGTTHVKMKLEAGQVARANGQVMLWNDGTDEAASGSILDGSQTITGISGVTQNLIRVAKWDDANQRIILNSSVTAGHFHDDVLTGGRRASMVFENGGEVFTLGAHGPVARIGRIGGSAAGTSPRTCLMWSMA